MCAYHTYIHIYTHIHIVQQQTSRLRANDISSRLQLDTDYGSICLANDKQIIEEEGIYLFFEGFLFTHLGAEHSKRGREPVCSLIHRKECTHSVVYFNTHNISINGLLLLLIISL